MVTVPAPVPATPTPQVAPGSGRLAVELRRFAVVGAVSTVLQLGLFAALHLAVAAQAANVVSLALSTVVNTAANGSWTFRGRRAARRSATSAQVLAFGVFALTWAATSAALTLLEAAAPAAPLWLAVGAVAAGTALSTVVRFVAMRHWIFARRR
ncbi:MAG: GtrA family protein [Dermatophilaceae bacterium]